MHKRLYITDTSQSSLLPRRGFCSPVSCWLLCSSTHCHEVAHYLSLSASLGGAHGFISRSLFLCLLSFPLADFQAATLVGAAHPSKLGHIHHRLVVSRRWAPQVRSDLLPTGGYLGHSMDVRLVFRKLHGILCSFSSFTDIINGAQEKCVLPPMDGYPHCEGKIKVRSSDVCLFPSSSFCVPFPKGRASSLRESCKGCFRPACLGLWPWLLFPAVPTPWD